MKKYEENYYTLWCKMFQTSACHARNIPKVNFFSRNPFKVTTSKADDMVLTIIVTNNVFQ